LGHQTCKNIVFKTTGDALNLPQHNSTIFFSFCIRHLFTVVEMTDFNMQAVFNIILD